MNTKIIVPREKGNEFPVIIVDSMEKPECKKMIRELIGEDKKIQIINVPHPQRVILENLSEIKNKSGLYTNGCLSKNSITEEELLDLLEKLRR